MKHYKTSKLLNDSTVSKFATKKGPSKSFVQCSMF